MTIRLKMEIKMIFFCLLLIPLLSVKVFASDIDPRNDFYHHSVIYPSIYTPDMERKDNEIFQAFNDDQLNLKFEAFGKNFTLELYMNKDLLPERFFEKYEENGKEIFRQPMKEGDRKHCHYQGHVQNEADSWVAVSLCDGVSGAIFDGKELYYIEPDLLSKSKHSVFKASDTKSKNYQCGVSDHGASFENQYLGELRQQIQSIKVPYLQPTAPRIAELIYVADYALYTKYQRNSAKVIERCKKVVNILNALFMPLNVYIALVGVVVWSDGDKIQVLPDIYSTTDAFAKYRKENLVDAHPNDVAQLISGITFTEPAIGYGYVGTICSAATSASIVMDYSPKVGVVASASAHELGHNFGMEHDTDSCQCSGQNKHCIMAPSLGTSPPRIWSSCSRETMQNTLAKDDAFCLLNVPTAVEGPVCGNGFVESNEQCDCGPAKFCTNQCCNPSTCRLHSNATCATGSCCDISTCRVKPARTVCRRKSSECDKNELCDGRSEFCPDDAYERNGKECGNLQSYCYDGKCTSHDDHCKILWGPTAQKSDDVCFDYNTQGSFGFNCGSDKSRQTFLPCNKGDVLCGRLHCQRTADTPVISSAESYYKAVVPRGSETFECHSTTAYVGSTDLGLTPNGAKCGSGKMCHNQKCVPV